jgi:hypothetical protein
LTLWKVTRSPTRKPVTSPVVTVTTVGVSPVITAPAVIPGVKVVSTTLSPIKRPAVLGTVNVLTVLPVGAVTTVRGAPPVKVAVVVTPVVAALKVTVVPVIPVIKSPAGTLVPVTASPTKSPVGDERAASVTDELLVNVGVSVRTGPVTVRLPFGNPKVPPESANAIASPSKPPQTIKPLVSVTVIGPMVSVPRPVKP